MNLFDPLAQAARIDDVAPISQGICNFFVTSDFSLEKMT